MKRVTIIAAVVALTMAPLGADDKKASVLLQAAEAKATVHGDLKAAIALYGDAVKEAGGNRALAAKALVRMAECYQKLGGAEAQKIYERVIREFADQKDAVQVARARLGSPGAGALRESKGDRPVWTGPNVDLYGSISPDGRYVSYVDWGRTGNLMLHDLTADTERALTRNTSYGQFGQAGFSAISKDGTQIAYGWDATDGTHELRVVKLDGTAVPESRRILGNRDLRMSPYDWSPDGNMLAVHITRQDLTGQIAVVSVQDGAVHGLKSVDWRGPSKIFFSPDGRRIAYDLSVGDTVGESHVFVLAVDGSREATVVADHSRNVIMGWSLDGTQLLFASNRTGSMALWAVTIADGKAAGAPRVVKSDIRSTWSLGMSAAGALYVYKDENTRYLRVASIDVEAGKLGADSPSSFQRFVGSGGSHSWSRDGERLVYRVCGTTEALRCTLAIASVTSGQVRELRPTLANLFDPQWSPDGQFVIVRGRDLKGRQGYYRVDPQTGDASPLLVPSPGQLVQWSSDGKKIYYRRQGYDHSQIAIVERDLTSGSERDLFRHTGEGGVVSLILSPDNRYIAAVEGGRDAATLLLIAVASGEPRALQHAKRPEEFDGYRLIWTPDSRAVIMAKGFSNSQRKELWLIPVTDGRPRKLVINVDNWVLGGGGFQLHPTGGQIAFVADAGGAGPEVWALENFLPATSKK